MKYCDKCKVKVRGTHEQCPLCQRNLQVLEEETQDVFPYLPTIYKSHHMIFKMMNFISIALSVISVALNLLISGKLWWPLYVIAGVGCFWISFVVAFYKRKNIPKTILYQVVIISGIVVLWDFLTGWKGWSVDFVIPVLCFTVLVLLFILNRTIHNDAEDGLIYMLIGGVFGILPIFFYVCGLLHVIIPSIICVATSILFFAAVIIFKGDKIREELKRRLHY